MNILKSYRMLTVSEARILILQRGGLAGQIAASLFDAHIRASGAVEIDKLTVPANWPDEPILIGTGGETFALRREVIGRGKGREVRSFVEIVPPIEEIVPTDHGEFDCHRILNPDS